MKVFMYDKDGNLIREFASIKDAANETGIKKSNIYRVCSLKKGTAGGYQFRYEKDFQPHIEKFKSNSIRHKKRKVIIYDKNGEFIDIADSIHEASRKTGVLPQNIFMCCKNKIKSVKGYSFKYAEQKKD